MGEGKNPITEDEAQEIVRGIDVFIGELGEEKERLVLEEEALLTSIEWDIRLRSREARVRDSTCVVARFEEWLDADQVPAYWLLNYSEQLFPEEAKTHELRTLSQDCAEFLWQAYREADEAEKLITREVFREWYLIWQSYEPLTVGVNLVTVRACVKRMLLVQKRAHELCEPEQVARPRRNRQWYEELLELYRLVSKYAEEEASGVWDDLEPPLPF